MYNIAVTALCDFENWNNQKSLSMGGASGVIKSILPFLEADNIYLFGITSEKMNLYKKIHFDNNIFIVPIIFVPKGSNLPVRFHAFYSSMHINSILKRFSVFSVYSHAEEISFWIKSSTPILYHMHGSTNALLLAKNKILRIKLLQNIWGYIRKKNIQKARKIIAIDSLCYDLIEKQKLEEKGILLPNFVNTNVFYNDKSHSLVLEQIEEKILLFVGRLEEVKGLELFVDTLIELNRRESGIWKGVFVGRGTYESTIKKYISEKSSNELFYFTGPIFEQDELRKIYSKASILMISSYFEGIPMVILESLACGTPVVSTNVGGVKDFIVDNTTCFVNDLRDPVLFADLIQYILTKNNVSREEFRFSSHNAAVMINKILSDK